MHSHYASIKDTQKAEFLFRRSSGGNQEVDTWLECALTDIAYGGWRYLKGDPAQRRKTTDELVPRDTVSWDLEAKIPQSFHGVETFRGVKIIKRVHGLWSMASIQKGSQLFSFTGSRLVSQHRELIFKDNDFVGNFTKGKKDRMFLHLLKLRLLWKMVL